MKVFVSQPMVGRDVEEIQFERDAIMEAARMDYGDVTEIPSFSPSQMQQKSAVELLGMSIQMLAQADLVFFAPGWSEANGCQVEHDVCSRYGIAYFELSEEEVDVGEPQP